MNTSLTFISNIRILGLTFDDKLNWRPHLKKLKADCLSRMKIIKTLGNNTWGSETKSLLRIYKSLILSVIDYGAIIYNSAKSNTLNTINPIHNQGIRLATGAFRTSPVDSILCNAGELTLELRRHTQILKFISRIKSMPNHIASKILHNPLSYNSPNNRNTIFEYFKIISENLGLQTQTFSKVQRQSPPWLWSPNINTQLINYCKHSTDSNIIRNLFSEIVSQQYSNSTHIYTDASKNSNGVGFATIIGHENHKFSLPPSTNIYTAETYAILEALKIASSSNSDSFTIIGDSLSALISI
ncbi:unnamed protein product [Macrosiphum euphorbiae]|uniref:RNase H type-1 domain-containing protein n=1 Tax=Macrosiphum euphorbiae TaxID=13131 RepID=A0AAV0WDL9_9HEMI|nr:unnamed protein product [Macrosiphum euphorbiae]